MSAGDPQGLSTRPLRIWVTRPQADAAGLALALREHGVEPVIEPLLLVELTDGAALPLDGVQAVLATSANGVRALARRTAERRLPLLAVGDATARAARKLGFTAVESAGGDVASLAERVCLRLNPAAGKVLHVAGTAVAGDLGGTLQAAGFTYRREVVYRVETPERLTDALVARWTADDIDGVVVFSPRTGRTLVRLLRQSGQADAARHAICFCLSDAVATSVSTLPWHRIRIAAKPTQEALLEEVIAEVGHRASAPGGICLSSTADFAVTLAPTANLKRTGIGAMSNDSKHDQRPGEAGGPSAASGTTQAATTGTGTATDAAQVGATGSQPPDASAGKAEPSDSSRADATESRGAASSAAAKAASAASSAESRPSQSPSAQSPASEKPASKTRAPGSPTSVAPQPEPPPARRGSGGLLWALALIILLAGGGAALWFGYLQPRLQPVAEAQPEQMSAEIEAAFSDLDIRVTQLSQQLDGMGPRLDTLERALAQLRQSVEQMGGAEGNADAAASAEALKEMNARVAVLESQAAAASGLAQQVRSLEAWTAIARDTASKVAANVLAVGQLVQAVNSGQPFVRPMAAVRALGGDDPEIAQAVAELEPLAARGIPTLSALRGAFPATADAIVRTRPVTDGTGGWTDRVVEQLASLVAIRRTGPEAIADGGVDGAVETAQMALADGNLQAAVAALKGLDGPPAQAAQPWLETAEQRLAAERALANLQQRAIARLSAAKG